MKSWARRAAICAVCEVMYCYPNFTTDGLSGRVTEPEYGSAALLIHVSLTPLALFPVPAWLWKGVKERKEGSGWENPAARSVSE